jgi:sulfatase modifying factor 1
MSPLRLVVLLGAVGLLLGDAGCSGQLTVGMFTSDAGSGASNGSSGSTLGSGASTGAAAPASCTILASDYDQSCTSDSDCVGVTAGNFCGSNPTCNCGGFTDAISVNALAQFNADVAKTPSGPQVTCPCPMPAEPPGTTSAVCCKNSTCGVCTTVLPPVCTPPSTRCVGNGLNTCAPNGQWQQFAEGCGPGTTCINGACMAVDAEVVSEVDSGSGGGPAPSCGAGGPGMTNCGPSEESCCTSLEVMGGTYFRTYTNDGSGPTGEADPAAIGSFRLDKYVVTVGRFRQFVAAWNGGWMPAAGSGKHTYLNGGNGLNANGGGYEPGWVADDDINIAPTSANLACDPNYATWTNKEGTQENLPINCVNWYEAYAFCIWDGGFLPSEAEWEYAAAGGSQQREYPWGSAAPGTTNQYAIYGDGNGNCYYPSSILAACTGVANIAPVGTATLGAGLWGQLDWGNVLECNLDSSGGSYVDPCIDCANVSVTAASLRLLRGGAFDGNASGLLPPSRDYFPPTPSNRFNRIGFRCSRSP